MANLNCFFGYLFILGKLFAEHAIPYVRPLLYGGQAPITAPSFYVSMIPVYVLIAVVLGIVWKLDGLSPVARNPARENQYRIGHGLVAVSNIVYGLTTFGIPVGGLLIHPIIFAGGLLVGPFYLFVVITLVVGLYLISRSKG